MSEMRAKDYLQQLKKLDAIIKNKMIEKEQWRDIALGITARTDGERVQSSGSQQKMANAIDKCIDIEREIDEMIDRLYDLKQEIIKTIEQLNATEYDVLHKRYVQDMNFAEIGASKKKTKSWATTVHGRALQNLQKILNHREQEEKKKNM